MKSISQARLALREAEQALEDAIKFTPKGGRVEIVSTENLGTKVKLHIPKAMAVRVGIAV